MFVIIEGPKCCGKTTLCNKLHAKYGGTIVHFPTNSDKGKLATLMLQRKLNPEQYAECQQLMEEDIDDTLKSLDKDKLWILDRSFISNAVYRDGQHIIIKDKYLPILDECMLVIILAHTKDIYKWIQIRKEKPLTEIEYSKLEWSNDRFHRIVEMLGCVKLNDRDIKKGLYYIDRMY